MLTYTSSPLPLTPYLVETHAKVIDIYATAFNRFTYQVERVKIECTYTAYGIGDRRPCDMAIVTPTRGRSYSVPITALRNLTAYVVTEL